MTMPGWVMFLLFLALAGAVFGLWMWLGRRLWRWVDRRWVDPWLRRRSGLSPAWTDEPEDYGCCALDDDRGSGHDGPCQWKCSTCGGTGECPECGGVIEDDLDWCEFCSGTSSCPAGCYEGWEIEELPCP